MEHEIIDSSVIEEYYEEQKEFLTICPRSLKYKGYSIEPIPLMVVRDGIETKPDININITELNDGSFALINHTNTKYRRLSFSVNVIIHKDKLIMGSRIYDTEADIINRPADEWGILINDWFDTDTFKDFKLIDMLDYWIRNATPLIVVSRLIDVPDAVYYITGNKKRKQEYLNYTVWELTFTKKVLGQSHHFNKDSKLVKKALKYYENQKKKEKEKKEKIKRQIKANVEKLKKCDYKSIKYSKTKKVTECNKVLQTFLYYEKIMKKDEIDGWYGKDTKNYVKKYQEKYKKKYNLKATGNLNKPTYNTMIGVRKPVKTGQIGKTITIESNLPKEGEIIKSK